MFSSNMDFNCAHFTHFEFAHFEIEESFELIWVKLGQIWVKFTE